MKQMTEQQVEQYVRAARDSVTVINEQLQKLSDGAAPSLDIKGNIERNVAHLKIVVAREEVAEHGGDIADLHAAVAAGEAKLAESIWG
jgi:hypothetical protein